MCEQHVACLGKSDAQRVRLLEGNALAFIQMRRPYPKFRDITKGTPLATKSELFGWIAP
jgi:hypothetical protein